MIELSVWWVILFLQGSVFAWSSRAKNSGSWRYAMGVATISHSLWLGVQFFIVKTIIGQTEIWGLAMAGIAYVSAMSLGNAFAVFASRKWLETGNRKIGS